MDAEIIVVDNASADGSIAFLRSAFPQVCFIRSDTNIGFAKGCNMGFSKSSGANVLFLNPDTIIAEDTLTVCLDFFKNNAAAGALGVRMIDGSGAFLKESKRSFPAPLTSAFKLAGLARLAPRSKTFSRYHLGHLDEAQNHEVDVLAGAFMMVRRAVLDEVGLFDETFFMYGEDVDLSYRIQKAGYKNYYIADTTIIHFKGESTRRGSLNYVRLFYSAMSLFVRKHYGGSRAAVFNFFIHSAIWLRAATSAAGRLIGRIGLPVMDALLFLLSFWVVKIIWAGAIKPGTDYPEALLRLLFPLFTLFYLVVAYYAGLYDKQYKTVNLARAASVATLALLALYALLPEQYRFSRGILVFGVLLAGVCMSAIRWALARSGILQQAVQTTSKPYILIAGSVVECNEVQRLMKRRTLAKILGRLVVSTPVSPQEVLLEALENSPHAFGARELILCSGTATNKRLIAFIQTLRLPVRLRFHAAGSASIVGSDSQKVSGQAHAAPYNLDLPLYRRFKRLIDVAAALLLLAFFPLHIFFVKKPLRLLGNAGQVLLGTKTWIGYAQPETAHRPRLRPGILTAEGEAVRAVKKMEQYQRVIDDRYARDWEPLPEISRLLKNYRRLDS